MAANLSEWRTLVNGMTLAAEAAGTSALRIADASKTQAIEDAVLEYSRHRPRHRVGFILGDGSSFDLSLPFGWVDDFSRVVSVQHPLEDSSGAPVENQDPDSIELPEHEAWVLAQVRDAETTTSRSALARMFQFDESAATFVEETTDANSATAADVSPFPATEAAQDYAAFGFASRFDRLIFDYAGGTAGVAGVVSWEYWNGVAWAALGGVVDATAGFTTAVADGLEVRWDVPSDWAKVSLNSTTAVYYVRARVTTVYTTNPTLDQVFVGVVASARRLRFLTTTPAADEWVKVRFTAPHRVDAATSTVPATDERAVAKLAAAYVFEMLAGYYVGTRDPNLAADSVNFGNRSKDALDMAKRFREDFYRHVGLKPDGSEPVGFASGVTSLVVGSGGGGDRILHPRAGRLFR